jgi:membrane protease YdiL (CAAX protease family)
VSPSRLRPLLAWTAFLIGGLFLTSLCAPFVYFAMLELLPTAEWPFSRIYNRTAMLIAVLLFAVLRRALGWRELPRLFTARASGGPLAQILAGLLAALLGTAFAAAAASALGWLAPALAPFELADGRTFSALLGGLVVAVIEESFFRGLMLVSLAAAFGTVFAAIASSGAYALAHLLVSDPALGRQGDSLGAGFAYLGQAVARQLEPASLLPLFGLFLCGLVLALAVRRSGALFLAIGLHAGWVLSFQILRHATRPLVEIPGRSYLATHHYLVGTTWAWAGVLLAGFLVLAWCFWVERRPAPGLRGARGARPAGNET